jgi:hypothetical protein
MMGKEHMQWCKNRAMEYLDMNDIEQAWADIRNNGNVIDPSINEWNEMMDTMLDIKGA